MTWQDKIATFAESMFDKIDKGITDVTKLDVTTMVGNLVEMEDASKAFEKNLNFEALKGKVEVVGLTRLDIDGDIVELLHGENGQLSIDVELLRIHKNNVKTATENWNRFFRNLIEITATIAAIADPDKQNRIDLVRALRANIEPIKPAIND